MEAFSIFLYFLISIFTIFLAVYIYVRLIRHTYWKRKNIKFEEPSFPFGNLKEVAKLQYSYGDFIKKIYDSHKGEKVVGVYFFLGSPLLIVRDLDIIRKILIKNFSAFGDRGFVADETRDPLSGHLFFLNGQKWKNLRIKLSPTFTSGKMKMMFPLVLECGKDLINHLKEAEKDEKDVDAKDIMSKFTTDVIASCAFGIEIRCFKNPDSELRHIADCFFKPTPIQVVNYMFLHAWPRLSQILRLRFVPPKTTNFFMGTVKDVFNYREENNVQRKDFAQLLIELKNKGKIESSDYVSEETDYDPTFTVEQAAAQAFNFFVGGYETSSTVLMFSLFELATNQNIQDKVVEEIDRVVAKHNGKITYEGIQEMEYLDRVYSETLRKYPPFPNLFRCSLKSQYLPEIDRTIDENLQIYIPVIGIHKDPEYYPDPEKFDPDRFLPENVEKRHPMCYLPFGDGPRYCIANRFASMVAKAALSMVLYNFRIVLSEKTKIPLEFDPKSPLMNIKGAILLKILRR